MPDDSTLNKLIESTGLKVISLHNLVKLLERLPYDAEITCDPLTRNLLVWVGGEYCAKIDLSDTTIKQRRPFPVYPGSSDGQASSVETVEAAVQGLARKDGVSLSLNDEDVIENACGCDVKFEVSIDPMEYPVITITHNVPGDGADNFPKVENGKIVKTVTKFLCTKSLKVTGHGIRLAEDGGETTDTAILEGVVEE